jgi:hypothetical protein
VSIWTNFAWLFEFWAPACRLFLCLLAGNAGCLDNNSYEVSTFSSSRLACGPTPSSIRSKQFGLYLVPHNAQMTPGRCRRLRGQRAALCKTERTGPQRRTGLARQPANSQRARPVSPGPPGVRPVPQPVLLQPRRCQWATPIATGLVGVAASGLRPAFGVDLDDRLLKPIRPLAFFRQCIGCRAPPRAMVERPQEVRGEELARVRHPRTGSSAAWTPLHLA